MTNNDTDQCSALLTERRNVLKTALGIGLGVPFLKTALAATEDDPKQMLPQIGDRFVFQAGDKQGQVIKPEDLPVGGPQQLVYPMDPGSGVVRDGSILNMILLIRLEPEEMSKKTLENAAEGVVAYSAICTHQACPVSMWREDKKKLFCSCHGSQFDPGDRAKVTFGPAPKRLAMLPLKMEEGVLAAAAGFQGRVGADKR